MNNFQDFIASFSFDQRLAPYDIEGSIAHVKMLARCKIIPAKDAQKILGGLNAIARDIRNGKNIPFAEDIHYAVEKELMGRIGPVGGKMHTARSRNDQVALDLKLYLRSEIDAIDWLLQDLQNALILQAEENVATIMPGYTHLQPAQPVLFAHHVLAYGWMFQRDRDRLADCRKRVTVLPLGSAALAGTSFPIDRQYVADILGFEGVMENSMDGVSDRDAAIEFLSSVSLISMHLSRLAEELVLWTSSSFDFVRLKDDFTSGSSIMPQKRNPDVAEIVRGKTGRVYGDLLALLTIMKGLPLAYNRDLQEDKPPVFDAADTVKGCLEVMAGMVATLKTKPENMLQATGKGYLQATELADYLARKGMPFRQAHGIVKEIVAYCSKEQRTLDSLEAGELARFSPDLKEDVLPALAPARIVAAKTSFGGTAPASVRRQIRALKNMLQKDNKKR
jgi:argininosuccinate lyase